MIKKYENLIVVGGTKGGTGKTTITLQLACYLSKLNHSVLVIDTDLQATAFLWLNQRNDENKNLSKVDFEAVQGKALAIKLEKACKNYDVVIIDVGGKASDNLYNSLLLSSMFICPIQTSQFDLNSLSDIKEIVDRAKMPYANVNIVFNRVRATAKVCSPDEAILSINSFWEGVNIQNTTIGDRNIYNLSASYNASIWELKRKDGKAMGELEILFNNLLGLNDE